jgi:peptidoglycan/xylan/chitin deacetylase (PgdA/CDA1 family)
MKSAPIMYAMITTVLLGAFYSLSVLLHMEPSLLLKAFANSEVTDAVYSLPQSIPSPLAMTAVRSVAAELPPEYIQYTDKVIVLMYHHIAPSEANEEITITPERFNAHLQALKDNHYQVISMEQYIRFTMKHEQVPPNAVVITFDDGYESFYTYAYPALSKFGFTATNFVVVSYIDSVYPQLPFLTWKEIMEMHEKGFSFYSHTYDLHRKAAGANNESVPALANPLFLESANRMETDEEYRNRVRNDLLQAKNTLHDRLGNPFPLLCFPYGAYNQTIIDLAKEAGINMFFTVKDGINSDNNREILRVNAGTRYVSGEMLLKKLDTFKARTIPAIQVHE